MWTQTINCNKSMLQTKSETSCYCSYGKFPWDDVLLHHFLRAVVERLGQCHHDGEPLVLCPRTKSSLPATTRCTTANAFVLHGSTTRVSRRLTLRLDLCPKWLRRWWWWCGRRKVKRSVRGEEEASVLKRPSGSLPAGLVEPLLVLVRCLQGALIGPFRNLFLEQSCS